MQVRNQRSIDDAPNELAASPLNDSGRPTRESFHDANSGVASSYVTASRSTSTPVRRASQQVPPRSLAVGNNNPPPRRPSNVTRAVTAPSTQQGRTAQTPFLSVTMHRPVLKDVDPNVLLQSWERADGDVETMVAHLTESGHLSTRSSTPPVQNPGTHFHHISHVIP